MKKVQKIAYISMIAMVLLMPALVFAVLPNPVPPIIDGGGGDIDLNEIEIIIGRIAQFLIIVGVILAVIFIIWGGIAYMFAGGDETKTSAAKARIMNGIIGAAVVLAVGVILQTVAGLISRSFFR